MAEPFQPKFVDLVRNTFATTGTGNLTIGQPIIGFASFATALSAGDQFYYCAINNDKPGEREVGRGTIMPDGTIGRDPIQGAPVSFTSGNKVIALVTPAEWFNTIQAGGSSGGAQFAATRAALAGTATAAGACVLREAGREGLFTFDGTNRSAEVAADSAQGLFVAPSGQNGSSGAWVRSQHTPISVKWFGAKGDGASADGPAFTAALAALAALKRSGHGFGPGVPSLLVPAGIYNLGTTTLDLVHPVRILGEGTGGPGGTASVLQWSNGTTGIRVQAYDTTGATGVQTAAANRGAESIIEGLLLNGGYVSGPESEAHGIHLRGAATIRDCLIQNFGGDGIFIKASAADSLIRGNANCFTIDKVFVMSCRCGLYAEGADANAGNVTNFNAIICRQAGVRDRSLLGNNYYGSHVAGNARTSLNTGTSVPCSFVSHGGNIYFVIPGQEAGAATNAPSGSPTSNTWWGYWAAGGASPGNGIPAWFSGIAARPGGGYLTSGAANNSRFYGAYAEDDQYNLVDQVTYLEPGTMSYLKRATGGLLSAKVARLSPVPSGGVDVGGDLLTQGDFYAQANGASHFIGPQTGPAADNQVYFDNVNFFNFLRFRSWSAGAPQTDAEIISWRGQGLKIRGRNSIFLENAAGDALATVSSAGLVVAGTVTASNLSGTNSGDQTITLTGDVTGSGGGSFAASIASNAVSYAKMQDVSAAARLIGRGSAGGAGDPQEITLGSRLSMSGTVLNASGDWTEVTLASDFTCANSTAFNDITDGTSPLTYTPPANSNFEIQAVLLIQTTTATNLPRVQVNVAAQGTGAFGCIQIDQTGATATARVTADGSFTTAAITVATAAGDVPAANTPYMCFITIRGRTGASPAAIKLQAACETAGANTCFVKAGSQMRTKAS